MTTQQFLKTQVHLLVAQFGRKTVLEAVAGLTDLTPEELQKQVSQLQANRRAKGPSREMSLDELIAALPPMPEEIRDSVMQLGRLLESKLFLPNLRDAEEFLRRTGAPNRRFKTRKQARGPVLRALSEMPRSELESLLARYANTGGKSDYAILANELMGREH